QYIFGDFSPDEFNQFFVTPRSSVELPPYNGTVLCGTQAPDELPDGQEYQRIEFGVNEVIEPNDTLPRTPNYSISSTLNPQAPEFILSCTTSKKIPDDIDKEAAYSSVDCQYPGSALALDGSSSVEVEVLENDGVAGGLGQRERKKKKKRPPGYYSYLKDGGEGSIPTDALVNGHANPAVPNSVGPEDVELAGAAPPLGTPRTCGSPQGSTDFVSDAVSGGPFPGALDGDARTAGQPGSCHGADLEQSCLPAEAGGGGALFHDSKPSSSSPVASVETKYSPPATSPLVSEKQVEVKEGLVPVSEDPVAIKIAELLENVTLIHKPVSLQPRGLINKGNWCYINATLQALVACPPMYHLMKFIPLYSKVQRPCTSTPMIDSFVRLMNEFTNMPVPPKPRQALGDKIVRDIRPGAAFEPTYIYRLLTVIKSSLSEKGRQEDAEEYLGFILNGLHEEMLNLKKLLSPNNQKLTVSNGPRSPSVHEDERDEPGEGSEDEWEQVGPRSKTSVTRQAEFVQTPITGIFGGHIRSVVYQQSSRESATLQPFFTLQLDIQSDKIRTVQDALESLVARESVQGYTTKTKQEYPVDLEISKELLSPGVKNKNFKCHRTYRLFIGLNGWLRIDDQTVKVVNQYQVVKPTAERTAYLLYYRRVDLL
uniref:Ubiquitin carboxyl-terminal hydrolase 10 n=1 Tax=Panthera tigris altaica TaxID=74533 RepID=A0A8C9JVT2_PANTA